MISLEDHELVDRLVKEAVDLSMARVAGGGIPFSALVVDQGGRIVGRGVNEVTDHCDPTAHAEVIAIRNACGHLRTTRLDGMTLIASGEPCALCYTVALWAGVDQVVFAVDRDAAARAGFDYRAGYRLRGWPPCREPRIRYQVQHSARQGPRPS